MQETVDATTTIGTTTIRYKYYKTPNSYRIETLQF